MLFWLLTAIAVYYVQVFLPAVFKLLNAGLPAYVGKRETDVPLTDAPGRIDRASANMRENFPAFAALALAALALGVGDNAQAVLGAKIFVIARIIYIPLYAAGVPFLRSLAAAAGWAGMIMMALPLVALA